MPKIRLPAPHINQRKVLREAKRFNCLICGRRWGKTWLGVDRAVDGLLKGLPVIWLAPTYKMLAPSWRQLEALLQPITIDRDRSEKYLKILGGGELYGISLDNPDAARGKKAGRVIWDEAAMEKNPDTFPAVVRPLLTDLVGDLWFLTTPRGRNWLFFLYLLGLDPNDPNWKSWQMPTSSNPYILPTEIADAKRLLPQRIFEQEYLAIFLEDGTGVFRGLDKVCILKPGSPQPGKIYTFGVDWGKSNDFTAISIMELPSNRGEKPKQVYLDRFNEIGWELQKGRLIGLAQKWKPKKILAEENSIGSPLIESLQREKIEYVTYDNPYYEGQPLSELEVRQFKSLPIEGFDTTVNTKSPLIESYALAIEKEEILLLDDPTQRGELASYELDRLPSGRYRYSAPTGQHDDTVIAGAINHETVQHRGVVQGGKNPFYG